MQTFNVPNVLAFVISVLLCKGRISQQMTIDADRSSNTGMAETMADNHVVPKVTALACANSLGSNTCLQVKDSCYCFVNQQLTWLNAYNYCQANKKTLLSIRTGKEQNNLVANILPLVTKDPIGSLIGVWTSGTYIPSMNVFYWASASAYLSFANWLQGEPNGVVSAQCIRLVPAEWNWASLPCDQWLPFICES